MISPESLSFQVLATKCQFLASPIFRASSSAAPTSDKKIIARLAHRINFEIEAENIVIYTPAEILEGPPPLVKEDIGKQLQSTLYHVCSCSSQSVNVQYMAYHRQVDSGWERKNISKSMDVKWKD
jgi:hypothetical protein